MLTIVKLARNTNFEGKGNEQFYLVMTKSSSWQPRQDSNLD